MNNRKYGAEVGGGALAVLLGLMCPAGSASAQDDADTQAPMPVAHAADGFSADEGYRLRQGFAWPTAYATGDRNVYYFLQMEEFLPHSTIWRAGAVSALDYALNESLAQVRASSTLEEMTLGSLLEDPRARMQGIVAIHRGRIIFERYPGMREHDRHMWFSVSKTITSLLVGLLEEEGKLDVQRAVDHYLPELAGTHWEGIPVIDILDMASGLDIVESEASRNDVVTSVSQWFQIQTGDTTGLGTLTADDILFAVGQQGPSGQVFEYSSLNTRMLGLLVERVSGRRMADLIAEGVWSGLGAEGDALVAVDLQGRAQMYGLFSSRLRDMARYGMLYTPSWDVVAEQAVVPQSLLDRIRDECRPAIFKRSEAGANYPQDDMPRCNSRQWDAIWADGDMYKAGAREQGLYVSPSRDLVVAWFSTTMENGWVNYARAFAKSL